MALGRPVTGNNDVQTEGIVFVIVPHTRGDGEEFVHVLLNNLPFLRPPNRRSHQPDHLQPLLILMHKSIFFTDKQATKAIFYSLIDAKVKRTD